VWWGGLEEGLKCVPHEKGDDSVRKKAKKEKRKKKGLVQKARPLGEKGCIRKDVLPTFLSSYQPGRGDYFSRKRAMLEGPSKPQTGTTWHRRRAAGHGSTIGKERKGGMKATSVLETAREIAS